MEEQVLNETLDLVQKLLPNGYSARIQRGKRQKDGEEQYRAIVINKGVFQAGILRVEHWETKGWQLLVGASLGGDTRIDFAPSIRYEQIKWAVTWLIH